MVRDEAVAAWIHAKVREFEGPLVLYALRMAGNPEDAQDAVQETFLRLCRQERSAIENCTAEWLFTVCRNCALNIRQSGARMHALKNEESIGDTKAELAGAKVEREESMSVVLTILKTLPESEQEVIWLKFYEGFSYREIAEITNHSVNHVGVLLHLGLKKIRERLSVRDNLLTTARLKGRSDIS